MSPNGRRLVIRGPYAASMREVFSDQLESVYADLATICDKVRVAVERSTAALLAGDVTLAEEVISADVEIDLMRDRIEDEAFAILSLQAPVARDLRMVVSALSMAGELERMGDLAVHVAKIARLRAPHVAVPVDLVPTVGRMAQIAEGMVAEVALVIRERDPEWEALAADEAEMDALRRSLFTVMLGEGWTHGVEAAVDVALLGRYYERTADHALSLAQRISYVVTGEAATAE